MAEERPEKRQRCANGWSAFGAGQGESTAGKVKTLVKVADATGDAPQPSEAIACGIGYLDHMLDQLNSHGQLRLSVQTWFGGEKVSPHSNEAYTTSCDHEVASAVGTALGAAVKEMLGGRSADGSFRFLVPLDEALTDLSLLFPPVGCEAASSSVCLAPFGKFPPEGRTRIGCFRTCLTEVVLLNFAQALNVSLTVKKLRGDNAHHIVEATFKSLARCLRAAMDAFLHLDLTTPQPVSLGIRETRKQRGTKETSIDISLNLDAQPDSASDSISTGLSTLDSLLRKLSTFRIGAKCSGDVWIDEHHSTEDVMITVGQGLHVALGSKAGCCRMAWAEAKHGDAQVLCVMDLSNRPGFCCDLRWQGRAEEMAGDVSVEMLHHCFESFVVNASMTVHLVQVLPAPGTEASALDLALAGAEAMGAALKQCVLIDPRRAGVTASSKGTLST